MNFVAMCENDIVYFTDGVMCRLHHMSNGNDIILTARANKLQQKTNHVVVHTQLYDKTGAVHQS